ncbi:MAG: hypothetical protein AB7K71_34640 [Polyangiaceae bacterium]
MSSKSDGLRKRIAAFRAARSRGPVPKPLQREVVAWAQRERERGRSWESLAGALGLGFDTVRKWCEGSSVVAHVRPVRVVERKPVSAPDPGPELELITPAGYRVRGLTLSQLEALLRGLS